MHVHYRNCSFSLKIDCKETSFVGFCIHCALVIFRSNTCSLVVKWCFLFFYLAAFCIQTRALAQAGIFAFPCISNSRANYSFCLHLPFQCSCAGVTKYSLATTSPCYKRELRIWLACCCVGSVKLTGHTKGENHFSFCHGHECIYTWGTGLLGSW